MSTLFLAQLIGPVMILVGLAFLLRNNEMKGMMKEMSKSTSTLFVYGMIEITAGIALVLKHNIWEDLTTVIISLLGWLMILEATFALLTSKSHIKRMMSDLTVGLFNPAGFVMVIVGVYLVWQGYFV